MTKQEKFSPPKHSTGDTAYLVVKAILSPIAGATELLERLISPPYQRRTDEWMKVIAEVLRNLEQNKGIKMEELQNNDLFITVVTQASRIAIGNHQREKLESLKNAIISSASLHEKEDIQLVFIRYVDELTPSHLYLLRLFINEEERLGKIKSYREALEMVADANIDIASKDDLRMLVGDLSTRGLIRVSRDIEDDEDIYHANSILTEDTNDDLPRIIVSEVARKFIRFISAL